MLDAESMGMLPPVQGRTFKKLLFISSVISVTCFVGAFLIGVFERKALLGLSLIGLSILLEAQPAAVASLPMGFHPLSGAIISILANFIPLPFLMLFFHQLLQKWRWLRKKLLKTKRWSRKYGHYGVWFLVVLSPFIGAYACVTLAYGMHWRPVPTFVSISIGVIGSALLITYGGDFILHIFHPFSFGMNHR
ncbi:small multi-drug export protein [Alicyclobacillus tolerans]|nr:small multi-drug export protein [Alicyclobacillus montanus]